MSAPLEQGLRIAGYAALFGRRDGGGDVIHKGAFARTLAQWQQERRDPLPLYWQHRSDLRIGWVTMAAEDQRGLRVIAAIDNPEGRAAQSVRRGEVSGLSFGYRAIASERTGEGRELLDVELFEVSLVTHPMQFGARVHLIAQDA